MIRRFALLSLAPLALSSCLEERSSVVASPSLSPPPVVGSSAPAPLPPPAPLVHSSDAQPVVAVLTDVGATGTRVSAGACEEIVLADMTGALHAEGEDLAPGDVLLLEGEGEVGVIGSGVAVLAAVRERPCDARTERRKKVVRASTAPALSWAGGTMRARLDVEKETSPYAYVGRLEGTAPVAEHAHAGTWEVICALEAAGTFTLNGEPRRLSPRSCVSVPPDVRHSWTPDQGTRLVAVQIYDPPGPEQRFKKLAQDAKEPKNAAADAGSR